MFSNQRRSGSMCDVEPGKVIYKGIEISIVELFGRLIVNRLERRFCSLFAEFVLNPLHHGNGLFARAEIRRASGICKGNDNCKDDRQGTKHKLFRHSESTVK